MSIHPKKLTRQPKAEAAVEPDALTPVLAADASALPPIPGVLDAATANDEIVEEQSASPVKWGGLIANRPVELPPNLTLATLKARMNGSKVKGQYLTPEEMHFFTRSWRPYRSLGKSCPRLADVETVTKLNYWMLRFEAVIIFGRWRRLKRRPKNSCWHLFCTCVLMILRRDFSSLLTVGVESCLQTINV